MADSPNTNSDGVIKFTITSDGTAIADTAQLISLEVTKSVNKISGAILEFLDGDIANGDFPLSNEDTFKPGSALVIKAGYGSDEKQIFSGIVIRHCIAMNADSGSKLIIECKDKAVGMTVSRNNCNFIKQKDSDIIQKLLNNYDGLTPDVKSTETKFEELVQFNCTDWDFLLTRAEANGFVVCVDDGKISVNPPKTSGAVLSVTYGTDLIEFNADIDARYQFKTVKAASWDIKTQKIITEEVACSELNKQGDLTSEDLAKTLSLNDFRLQTSTPLEKTALKGWASAQQVKSSLAKIRGTMTFQGTAKAKIGSIIEVLGMGKRFNGDVYVSGVTHRLSGGTWVTDVTFGMSPDWSADFRDLAAPIASGLMPGVDGLQIGVVMKLDEDPEEQCRIQVSVPILDTETPGVWARLSTYYASSGIGNFFVPEIGDEVVLGYFNNNPCEPVILGSLYSSKNKPPYKLTKKNETKAIITKEKLTIEFDEKDKVITVTTPGNNKIVLSDKDKSILLEDQNKNKVELNDGGITLDSPKDIKVSAKGKISLNAVGDIAIKSSTGDVKAEGLNVNLTAQVGLVAKGSATAELSASGKTTVKGAMVMIN